MKIIDDILLERSFLKDAEMTSSEILVLACLFQHNKSMTTKEIVKECNSMQPSICTALNVLHKKGYVSKATSYTKDYDKKTKKGRPFFKFELAKSKEEIKKAISQTIITKHKRRLDALEGL